MLLFARRGPLVFAFNFHPTRSYPGCRIGVPDAADYRLWLNTDDLFVGGHAIVQTGQVYPIQAVAFDGRPQSVQIYLPARTAQVLETVS
jgi:1,4-alpha-glucan branching enzyme